MKIFSLTIKLLILALLVMIGLLLYMTCSGSSCIVQRIDKMPPEIEKAPWEIQTPTHLYYAEDVSKTGNGDLIISGWYEYFKEKWVYHEDTIKFPKKIYGDILPKRR